MSMTNCSVEECKNPMLARSYCNKHYIRWKIHGDPNQTNRTGVSKLPEYQIWASMKDRCNNPNSQVYFKYGARGIKVCDRWLQGFENFYKDMGDKPTPQHSIDRKDNDGDYTTKNCRWATKTEQSINRNTKPGISGYRGVLKNGKKWSPHIALHCKTYTFGSYNTPEEAAYVREQVALQLYNFMS